MKTYENSMLHNTIRPPLRKPLTYSVTKQDTRHNSYTHPLILLSRNRNVQCHVLHSSENIFILSRLTNGSPSPQSRPPNTELFTLIKTMCVYMMLSFDERDNIFSKFTWQKKQFPCHFIINISSAYVYPATPFIKTPENPPNP